MGMEESFSITRYILLYNTVNEVSIAKLYQIFFNNACLFIIYDSFLVDLPVCSWDELSPFRSSCLFLSLSSGFSTIFELCCRKFLKCFSSQIYFSVLKFKHHIIFLWSDFLHACGLKEFLSAYVIYGFRSYIY